MKTKYRPGGNCPHHVAGSREGGEWPAMRPRIPWYELWLRSRQERKEGRIYKIIYNVWRLYDCLPQLFSQKTWKNILFSLGAGYSAIYRLGSCRTENKLQQALVLPAQNLLPMPSPKRPILGGPSPRRENASGFKGIFEAQEIGTHVVRKARTPPPRLRNTPRRFVSRPHKSRGDPRSRTGLQSRQIIVIEGAQRPVNIYVYIHIYICMFI